MMILWWILRKLFGIPDPPYLGGFDNDEIDAEIDRLIEESRANDSNQRPAV